MKWNNVCFRSQSFLPFRFILKTTHFMKLFKVFFKFFFLFVDPRLKPYIHNHFDFALFFFFIVDRFTKRESWQMANIIRFWSLKWFSRTQSISFSISYFPLNGDVFKHYYFEMFEFKRKNRNKNWFVIFLFCRSVAWFSHFAGGLPFNSNSMFVQWLNQSTVVRNTNIQFLNWLHSKLVVVGQYHWISKQRLNIEHIAAVN